MQGCSFCIVENNWSYTVSIFISVVFVTIHGCWRNFVAGHIPWHDRPTAKLAYIMSWLLCILSLSTEICFPQLFRLIKKIQKPLLEQQTKLGGGEIFANLVSKTARVCQRKNWLKIGAQVCRQTPKHRPEKTVFGTPLFIKITLICPTCCILAANILQDMNFIIKCYRWF